MLSGAKKLPCVARSLHIDSEVTVLRAGGPYGLCVNAGQKFSRPLAMIGIAESKLVQAPFAVDDNVSALMDAVL